MALIKKSRPRGSGHFAAAALSQSSTVNAYQRGIKKKKKARRLSFFLPSLNLFRRLLFSCLLLPVRVQGNLARTLSLSLSVVMGFQNRKLLLQGSTANYTRPCSYICDPKNDYGICPQPCLALCPSICGNHAAYAAPPPIQANKPHNLSPPLISMLIFLASILLLVSSYVIYTRFYTRMINTIRSRSRRNIINPNNHTRDHHDFLDEEHGPMADNPFWYITTVGLQSSIINSITVCKYKKGEGLVEGTDCAVCLTEFEEDDSLRLLPKCNHAFHIPCIDTWLSSHTNCPLCRAPIISSVVNFPPPLPSSSAANSSLTENTHVENPENNCSFRRDLRISAEEEGELNRTSSRRKTISMDFASGSSINFQAWSNSQLVKLGKAVAASSRGVEEEGSSSSSSIQPKCSASMKRSMSCSGMLLSSRNSTGRNTQI